MLGVNCSAVGCGTSRRTKGIGIKLSSAKNHEYKKWMEEWLSEITKTRVIDRAFKEKTLNDSVHAFKKHFKTEAAPWVQ